MLTLLKTNIVGIKKMKKHKFRAVPTIVDGIRFASKKEAKDYETLKMLEKAKKIKGLVLQPRFKFEVVYYRADSINRRSITKTLKYVADFMYEESGKMIVHDSKGYETKEFKLKKKLFLEFYPEYELRIT